MKNLHRLAGTLLLLVLLTLNAKSQDDQLNKLNFDTQELPEVSNPYYAFGLGYTGSFLLLNYNDLNKLVADKLGLKSFSGAMFVSGFHGFTGIIIVPNVKFGVIGFSGSKKEQIPMSAIDDNGLPISLTRHADYSVNVTGFTLDYSYVPMKTFAISAGAALGWGSLTLDSYQNAGSMSWNDLGNISGRINYYDKISKSILFVEPSINLEYAITNFFMLKAGVSYNLTLDNFLTNSKWKLNTNTDVKDVPTGINGNGLGVKFGAYLGVFNF